MVSLFTICCKCIYAFVSNLTILTIYGLAYPGAGLIDGATMGSGRGRGLAQPMWGIKPRVGGGGWFQSVTPC